MNSSMLASSAFSVLGISALQARGIRGAGIRIGLVDSGVDRGCTGLAGAQITTLCLDGKPLEKDAPPATLHGTWCAGILVGQQIGICPDAEIISVEAFTDTQGQMAKGVSIALDNHVDIINVSDGEAEDPELTAVVKRATDAGVVVVAAADNADPSSAIYPSYLSGVLGVINCAANGRLLHPGVPDWIRLVAFGTQVTTYEHDTAVAQTGTSFATAVVSGVCALLLGVVPAARRSEVGLQLNDILYATGIATANSTRACRIVQPAKALDKICSQFAIELPPTMMV
jgi:subtilisin family serine protease